jgi:mono/diheme cytochrome c family protein
MTSPSTTPSPRRWLRRRGAKVLSMSALGAVLAIQLVPYGRTHTNPPVTGEPVWDTLRTQALARRACYACHSNETTWPWYSHVAPMSWRIQSHVEEGRSHLNFSEFDRPQEDADEAAEAVRNGEMPLWDYVLAHSEARLSPQESADLALGLRATFGSEGKEEEENAWNEDEDAR